MATKRPIGTAEAAAMLGVLPQTVVRLIRDGAIPGFKVRDVWRVYREDVEASIQRQMEMARRSDEEEKGLLLCSSRVCHQIEYQHDRHSVHLLVYHLIYCRNIGVLFWVDR